MEYFKGFQKFEDKINEENNTNFEQSNYSNSN